MEGDCRKDARCVPTGGLGLAAMDRVLIIQTLVKQYREPFFSRLYSKLDGAGSKLTVLYSDPIPAEKAKGDNIELPAEYGLKVPGHWFFRGHLLLQPVFHHMSGASLVVLEQANKYIVNHLWLATRKLRTDRTRTAFWGHGFDRQGHSGKLSTWWKRKSITAVDWWFAYTPGTVQYLIKNGFPESRITNVQNAVDTTKFRSELGAVTPADCEQLRQNLGVPKGAPVALFCGGLHRDKCLGFLRDCSIEVKKRLPNFHLVVVGSGSERAVMEAASREHDWIHFMGPRFGQEKAAIFKIADIFVMPGMVGLAVLDSFAAGLPVLTTESPTHSPEIEYVESGRNGIIAPHSIEGFSGAILTTLSNAGSLETLRAGASRSVEEYTIDAMVENFAGGIMRSLEVGASA